MGGCGAHEKQNYRYKAKRSERRGHWWKLGFVAFCRFFCRFVQSTWRPRRGGCCATVDAPAQLDVLFVCPFLLMLLVLLWTKQSVSGLYQRSWDGLCGYVGTFTWCTDTRAVALAEWPSSAKCERERHIHRFVCSAMLRSRERSFSQRTVDGRTPIL